MDIPDFLFASLSNLSLFTISSRLWIKLQIGKERLKIAPLMIGATSMPRLLSGLVQG
jgi:hypothetical protein